MATANTIKQLEDQARARKKELQALPMGTPEYYQVLTQLRAAGLALEEAKGVIRDLLGGFNL